MLKICVCDDNEKTARNMGKMINRFCKAKKRKNTVEVYYNGDDLLEKGSQYDIIFLDVEMPVMDGIHVGKIIRKNDTNAKIIYMTGHGDYMGNAFSVHAFDYLKKPFGFERVEQVLEEVIDYIDGENSKNSFNIMVDHGVMAFKTRDVYYLERFDRKVKLSTKTGEQLIAYNLGELYEILKDKGFETCHKSYVVNLYYVKAIYGFEVEMKNGDKIPLAQKRAVEFKKILYEYLHEIYNII